MTTPATDTAVILAAGWGSRVQSLAQHGEKISKPLIELGGEAMIARVIRTLAAAGIRRVVVITGFLSELVEARARAVANEVGIECEPVFNPRWHDLANGVSALAAADYVAGSFLLTMSDHAYDLAIPKGLLAAGLEGMGARLGIDRKLDTIFDMDDATKVVTEGPRIVNIGKSLADYNAVDMGLFLCGQDVFVGLSAAFEARGDCSLSEGMRILGQEGRFGYYDIGPALWQDVDTPETLAYAEKLLAQGVLRFPE